MGARGVPVTLLWWGLAFLAHFHAAQAFHCPAHPSQSFRHSLVHMCAAQPQHKRGSVAQWRRSGALYVRNVFNKQEADALRAGVKGLRGVATPERGSMAQGRLSVGIPPGSPPHTVFTSNALTQRVRSVTGLETLEPAEGFPCELRIYRPRSHMNWHVDEKVFAEPQVEAIYTLDNTSDSETQWIDHRGEVQSITTESNSMILIQAEGPEHQVTEVTRGERTIIKAVFTSTPMRSERFKYLAGVAGGCGAGAGGLQQRSQAKKPKRRRGTRPC